MYDFSRCFFMKTVFLSGIRYQNGGATAGSRLADVMLLRAVRFCNRFIKPDLVVLTGVLALDRNSLEELSSILQNLNSPWMVIPGEEDLSADIFYSVMPETPEFMDAGGIRFIPDLPDGRKISGIAASFPGRSVLLRSKPFAEGEKLPDFISAIHLVVSGNSKKFLNQDGAVQQVCVPALSEEPFCFLEIDIDAENGDISSRLHQFRLPDGYGDYHLHTGMAYCQQNLTIERMLDCIETFNLSSFALTEHSGHLLLAYDEYNFAGVFSKGLAGCNIINRVDEYRRLLDSVKSEREFFRGLEVDVDINGSLIADAEMLKLAELKVGAVHSLGNFERKEAGRQLMARSEALLAQGCQVLAHPFRAFRRSKLPVPDELFVPMADLLYKYRAAAEINFHTNDPEPEFFKLCLERGIKLSLGSDSHNLYEVGWFAPHLAFLEEIGASKDDLFTPHR